MAILDRRLIPLIDALPEAGADWLVFELIEGIRRGFEETEGEDALAQVRANVRTGVSPKKGEEPRIDASVSVPISGDDEIEWAVKHVSARIETTLAEMTASLISLDAIVNGYDVESARGVKTGFKAAIVLLDDDNIFEANFANVVEGRDAAAKLSIALANWADLARKKRRE